MRLAAHAHGGCGCVWLARLIQQCTHRPHLGVRGPCPQVGCGAAAVEDFFARQRAAARAALQRAQRRAGGDAAEALDPDPDPAVADGGAGDRAGDRGAAKWAADVAALDGERNTKLADLDMLLNGDGRIARPDFAGARALQSMMDAAKQKP